MKLNSEIVKNKKLEEENKKLKEKINSINQFGKEYEKLNSELFKLRNENSVLISQLKLKENQIKDLQNQISNNIIKEPKYNFNDILVIYFRPLDYSFHKGIKCLPSDTFAEVEEKLYKIFDDLRDTNNMFTFNAKTILRFKTINENGIKDGDEIQLFKIE